MTRRVRSLTTATVAAASVAVGALTLALSGTTTAEGTSTTAPTADVTQPDSSVAPGETESLQTPSLQAPENSPGRSSGHADAGTGGS